MYYEITDKVEINRKLRQPLYTTSVLGAVEEEGQAMFAGLGRTLVIGLIVGVAVSLWWRKR